jgi:hypothetical protein
MPAPDRVARVACYLLAGGVKVNNLPLLIQNHYQSTNCIKDCEETVVFVQFFFAPILVSA